MSTRSQKRINIPQEGCKNVGEIVSSPILVENVESSDQDASVAGPTSANSSRIENSVLKGLRTSLKEEITTEIKGLLAESQKELLKLLKSKPNESIREQEDNALQNEPREFYTPTRSVRISSILNNDQNMCRNNVRSNKTILQGMPKIPKNWQRLVKPWTSRFKCQIFFETPDGTSWKLLLQNFRIFQCCVQLLWTQSMGLTMESTSWMNWSLRNSSRVSGSFYQTTSLFVFTEYVSLKMHPRSKCARNCRSNTFNIDFQEENVLCWFHIGLTLCNDVFENLKQ